MLNATEIVLFSKPTFNEELLLFAFCEFYMEKYMLFQRLTVRSRCVKQLLVHAYTHTLSINNRSLLYIEVILVRYIDMCLL